MSKKVNTSAKQVKAVVAQTNPEANQTDEFEVVELQHTQLAEVSNISASSKATKLMQASKSTRERADKYNSRIARKILMDKLEPIQSQIENIEDQIFDLENINLDTNLNRGVREITMEQVTERFEKILDLTFEKDVLTLEYNSKVNTFNKYFGEVQSDN